MERSETLRPVERSDSARPGSRLKKTLSGTSSKDKDEQRKMVLLEALAQDEESKGWNSVFKMGAARRNEEKLREFWTEVRSRVLLKFESVADALVKLDTNGEGFITFLRFQDLLRMLHIPLNSTIARSIFDKVSNGGRVILADSFQAVLVERTIRSLRFIINSFEQKQESVKLHIHRFLRLLASSTKQTRVNWALRFQRKLTVPYIRSHWKALMQRTGKKANSHPEISKKVVLQMANEFLGKRWQEIEISFLGMLFDKVCQLQMGGGRPRTAIDNWITALVCVSSDQDPAAKVMLLCEVMDTDYDSCLLFDQILEICRQICCFLPLGHSSVQYPVAFRDELIEQEALHVYEQTRWHMMRRIKAERVVTVVELWEVWHSMPDVVCKLFPGSASLRWLATEWSSDELKAPDEQVDRRLKHGKTDNDGLDQNNKGRRQNTGAVERLRKVRSAFNQEGPGLVSQELPVSSHIRESVSTQFQKALRHLGTESLTELNAADSSRMLGGLAKVTSGDLLFGSTFKVSTWDELAVDLSAFSPHLTMTNLSWSSRQRVSTPKADRNGQPGGLKVSPGLSRSVSAPSVSMSSGLGSMSPTGGRSSSRMSDVMSPGSKSRGGVTDYDPSRALPTMKVLKWGPEAQPRLRLVSSALAVQSRARQLQKRPDEEKDDQRAVAYRCQLCQWNHNFVPER